MERIEDGPPSRLNAPPAPTAASVAVSGSPWLSAGRGARSAIASCRRRRVTVIDGLLAVAVLAGLVANAALRWWWADPAAAFVLVYYGLREGVHALGEAAT